jgi:hypothetical protein
MQAFPELEITRILSPSGAAAKSYNELVKDGKDQFTSIKESGLQQMQ